MCTEPDFSESRNAGGLVGMETNNSITPVSVAGSHFEIGTSLGAATGDAIRDRVFTTPEFAELKARWLNSTRLGQLEEAARSAYPEFVREIEGMAAGAELDFETLFLWNCRGDLRLPPDGAEAEGCTCVLQPAVGHDKPAIIAHNEDGAPEFLGHCFWVTVNPDDGPGFQSFMYPGMLPGHTFGMNAWGLAQTINNIRVHDLQIGVPRQIITRAVLACRELNDAVDILKRKDRASGFHHALGQAGLRRLVSVEAPASECYVKEIEVPSGHANHVIDPSFDTTRQTVTRSSMLRQAKVDTDLGIWTREEPEVILFDTETPVYRANDDGDDYAQTLATGVLHLYANGAEWTVHASPSERHTIRGRLNI